VSAPERESIRKRSLEDRLAAFLTPSRARIYSMLMVAVIFGGYLVSITVGPLRSGGFTDAAGAVIGADYSAFYWAGHAVVHGRIGSLYDIEAQAEFLDALIAPAEGRGEVHAFVSPPYWALFFLPFGALPYPVALTAFWILSALLLVGMVRVLRTELPQLEALGSTWRITALSLCFFPVLFSFLNGQTSMLLLAVLVGFFVLLRRGDDFTAGLVLGLLAIKPQIAFGPTLMLLAARRWRGLLGAALGASVWLLIGALVMPGAMLEYRIVAPELFEFLRSDDYQTWGQTSLYGLATLLLDPISHLIGGIVGNVFLLAAVITHVVLVYKTPWTPGSKRWDLAMAGAFTLGLLSSPHLFLYDVSLLALPLAILVARLNGEREGALLDGGPILVATGVMAATVFFGPYLTLLEQNTMRDVGLPRVALQICSITMLLFAVRIWQRAFAEPDERAREPMATAAKAPPESAH
jgi:hypothetical protein